MSNTIADNKDIEFALFDQFGADKFCDYTIYKDFTRKTVEMIINEARIFATRELLPTFELGDRGGLDFKGGKVSVPQGFHRAYDLLKEGGWIAMTPGEEYGGQGMPFMVAQAATDYLLGANYPFYLYGYGTFAAGEMLEEYGTDKQKEMFLEKLYSGQWGGTMAMTEPEAGSDVGSLSTSAVKNPDGTYSITGNKIFITNAEHDLTKNIIHMVLARIEGAPPGTKGISLFIVPKIWLNEDGSLSDVNDVVCTGIESKMGMHASPTCSMSFGDKGKCKGLLLGEENGGMKVMFHMMNAARLGIGAVGLTSASTAYLYALNYARERRQGSDIGQSQKKGVQQVPIIKHPDVRRMLMWMKAHVEGMRSLVYFGALCLDKQRHDTGESKRYYKGLLDLITPVIKSYCTDRGFDICSQALQVYGGYGYTKEYPMEQLLRDVRIASIYEGTNGIQAMDLLGRKLGIQKGKLFNDLKTEIQKVTGKARKISILADLGEQTDQALGKLEDTIARLLETMEAGRTKSAFLHAVPLQDAMGDILMAWMLLWRAIAAYPKLKKFTGDLSDEAYLSTAAKNKTAGFYDGQIRSARYFIQSILPVTKGRLDSINQQCDTPLDMPETAFGGY
jgi:alkylation response protein AidB-like acyl-CoA dehydrogenase